VARPKRERQTGNRTHPPVASPEIVSELAEASVAVTRAGTDPLGPVVEMAPLPKDQTEVALPITLAHEVHALLLAGHTPYEIAHHLTIQTGRRWDSKEVDALGDQVARENIDRTNGQKASIFQREVDRIEVMIKALWPQCQDGNHQAIDRMVKLQQRKAELLGLDHPDVKVSLSLGGKDGPDLSRLSADELRQLKALYERAGAVVPIRDV